MSSFSKIMLSQSNFLFPEINIKDVPVIKAHVGDSLSVLEMCKRTKLLLNCVGPYNLYGGEMIVSNCIQCKTHYIDISAEIKYLDTVQANYFNVAREKGVYIIEACGLGSLPTDYGIALLMKKFPGGLESVEYFIEFIAGSQRMTTGYGTYLSGVHSIIDYFNSSEYRKQVEASVFRKKITDTSDSVTSYIKKFPEKGGGNSWCLKYLGVDVRNIKRSQMFRANYLNNESYIKFLGYLKLPFYEALVHIWIFFVVCFLSYFMLGRSLLEKYPSFFTVGKFTRTGPTRQQVLETSTKIIFYAKGWKNKTSDSTNKIPEPDKKMKLTIIGPEPAYSLTAMCMVQSGLTVLFEQEKIPLEGGVYTPGVAFENTTLQERLEKRGMTFTFEEIL
ncbi:probable mitochondrial saccharopine dehydrogenase-like oxidoreductase At5g39410 [Caerostris extrusa]|uniref:Probable mitochondrial saccharopine dehydrogenase-like oxidoreductase At5g39410 n=1 Tax=Caerostris extrusa TaxID=172846 RepID=A0AAV4UHD7_CAEEX|nr:probable mitochondrial saccharopine dehydrogenase-like oxidoreductase At5g39410 [Caerostris extrusa]